MKEKVGFIGLGVMGKEMASNILAAGYPLVVWNRTVSKAEELVSKGAKLASGPGEVAREADVIMTMLSADQQVKDVLLGPGGVIEHISPGKTVIDSSTVSPATSRALYNAFKEKGVDFLDAPVTGSAPQAKAAKLGFMVGGDKKVFERWEPLFRTMGHAAVYLGQSGAGSVAKLANNTMAAISLLALAEGLTIATKGGLDPYEFIRVVAAGGAYSKMAENKHAKIIEGDFSTQFAVKLMNKDLGLAVQMCEDLGVSAPVLGLAKQILRMTINKGYGEEDIASVYKLYEEWAGKS